MASRSTGFRRNPCEILFLLFISICFCVFSIEKIILYSKFANLQYRAQQIERGLSVEAAALDRLIIETYASGIESQCQSAFVKPFLTILLASLDTRDPNSDYDRWFEALNRTENFLRHAISCLPTDGNLWARYAMVRQASAEQSEELDRLLSLSQKYSPSEENAITARYFLYNRLTNTSLLRVSALINKDVEIICSASAATLRRKIPAPKPRLVEIIKQIAPSCPIVAHSGVNQTR